MLTILSAQYEIGSKTIFKDISSMYKIIHNPVIVFTLKYLNKWCIN